MGTPSYRESIMRMGANVSVESRAGAGTGKAAKSSQLRDVWHSLRRNKLAMFGMVVILLMIIIALLAPVLCPEGYDNQVLADKFSAPSGEHLFGTDNYGRDILTRCVWGARYSLGVGISSVAIAVALGAVLGLVAGFYGGSTDNLIMRALDIFMSVPPILLAMCIAAALGGGLFNLMLAIGVGNVPGYARIVRASVMSVKDQEFVEAARATGCTNTRIMFKYVLPNCLSPLIVQGTMGIASAILTCAGMTFIGLGLQPPIPEWGAMLSVGRPYIRQAWWICTFPGLVIAIAVFALNVFGDGLRDALDPKLKR